MKKAVGVALVLLIGLPVLAGITVADLERRAATSLLAEERLAAAYALVDNYVANKAEADLLAIIDGGRGELPRAAGLALGELWLARTAWNTEEPVTEAELEALIEDARVWVREAAVPAYFTILMEQVNAGELDADDLEAIAMGDVSEQAQYAAGKAWFTVKRGQFETAEALLEVFEMEDATVGFFRAASDLLAGLYKFPPAFALDRDEIEALTLQGENEYIRQAAALALTDFLRMETADALYAKLPDFIPGGVFTAEYRWAHAYALGVLWAKQL